MARPNVFGLIFKVDATEQKKFAQIGKEVDKLSGHMNKSLGGSILNLKNVLIGGAVASGFKFIIDQASQMQSSVAAFSVMLGGSEAEATKLVNTLKKIGAETPFEFNDLAETTKTMMQFGIQSEEAVSMMQMLGDVAMGDANKLKGLALVMGQVSSAGKLNGQDLMQLINQGFNPLQIMSQKTGKSMAQLRDEMSKGKISADMVKQAFKDATSQGGMFFQGMDKGAKTFAGRMSTMQDAIGSAAEKIGTKLLPALEKLVIIVTDVATYVGNFIDENWGLIEVVGELVLVLGSAYAIYSTLKAAVIASQAAWATYTTLVGLANGSTLLMVKTWLAANAAFLMSPIGIIIASIAALIAIGVLLYMNWDKIVKKASEFWEWLKKLYKESDSFRMIVNALGIALALAFSPVIIPILAIINGIIGIYKAYQWVKSKITGEPLKITTDFVGIPGLGGGGDAQSATPQSANAGVINSNTTTTNRSQLDVNIGGLPQGSSIRQSGSAPGISVNTGRGASRP